jgi:glycosyltransferase involved in cell wall biosynthesis
MKKVLILYKFLPQYRVDFFQILEKELFKSNVELELIYGKLDSYVTFEKEKSEIQWAKYVANKVIKIGKINLIWQPCIKYLKDKDLVIVEQQNTLLLNYYLIVASHFSKYKLAFWGHGLNLQENNSSVGNRFKSFFLKKCDWWFAYTKGVKNKLVSMDFPENRITIVQNAYDTKKLRKYYSEINESEQKKIKSMLGITSNNTGIYCGRMYPQKGLDYIINACLRIKESIPDFHIIFIGSGIESYRAYEASLQYSWIHFVGAQYDKDRLKYFKISAIQLMPRLVGLGMLDSFAFETPIITTSHPFHGPEIEYLENGINGIITNDSFEEYTQSIIELLRTKKYTHLIDGCIRSANTYTIENMVENYKNGVLACLD